MATGNVPITAGSGTPVRVVTNAAVDSGANQQVMTLADANGVLLPTDPDGTLQTSPEATGLFLDDFSGTLTNRWTTGGTAPTTSAGVLTTSSSTTASLLSYMRTIGVFQLRAGSYLGVSNHVRHETGAVTNNTRAWGLGLYGTPSSTVPITNGAVFELWQGDGGLYASIYSNGVRTSAQALTRRTDGAFHKYEIVYRQSIVYWLIDNVLVATLTYPNIAVADLLAGVVVSANGGTSPGAGPVLNVSSSSVRDLSGTNTTISDGSEPWRQVTVKAASAAIATTDLPMAVGLHPSSPLPAGSSQLGWVGIGAVTPSASYYTSTTTNAATVAKSSAGQLQALVLSNTSTSAQFVKLFNATSVTLGTTAAVIDIPVAASSTVSLPMGAMGLRFTTGIAYTVTGAAGATNNTAGAGGVLVAATYV